MSLCTTRKLSAVGRRSSGCAKGVEAGKTQPRGGFLPSFVRSASEGQNSEAPSAFPLKEREERNIPDSLGKCTGKREGGRPPSFTYQAGGDRKALT